MAAEQNSILQLGPLSAANGATATDLLIGAVNLYK